MGESGAARSGLRFSVRAMRKRWRRASTGQVPHVNHSDAKEILLITIWWRQFPWHFYLGGEPSVRRGKHLQKGHEKPDQGEVKSDKCCSLLEMLLTDTWHCPVLITGRRGMRGRPWWRPETDNITKMTNRQIPRLPWRPSSRWRSLGKEGLDKFS